MKKSEIEVGGHYIAKVSGKLTTVRVDHIKDQSDWKGRSVTSYDVTNLATGRKITFRSAQKFRELAVAEAEQQSDPTQLLARPCKLAANLACGGKKQLTGIPSEPKPGAMVALMLETVTTLPSSPGDAAANPAEPPETRSNGTPLARILSRALEQAQGKNQDTAPHLIVEARAGTGKTTTLIEGLKLLRGEPSKLTPSPQQAAIWDSICLSRDHAKTVCFVAFNKSIATELQRRVPKGCDAMTMHSLGFRAVTKALGRMEVNSFAVQDVIAELLEKDVRWLRANKPTVLKATEELVSLCKMNLTPIFAEGEWSQYTKAEELSQLAAHYDVDLNGDRAEVFDLVPRVLERCKQPRGKINFDDMVYLPVVLNLPIQKYDLLLVDECLPGWTPVMLADGTSKTIQEIVESNEVFFVRAYSTKLGRPANCRVTGKRKLLNQKPLVKIKVKHFHRTGTNQKCNFVICTVDHKVWTVNRGWVPAGEVCVGDEVIIETAAKTTQRGKITAEGRGRLANLQKGNQRGLGNKGGDPAAFNRIKGGNGRGPTLAEKVLLDALGFGWTWSHAVNTGDAPQYGRSDRPSHYKIDIAEPNLKIAVEVDGRSHCNPVNQKGSGWKVIRVSNQDAIQRTSSVVAQLTFLANKIGVANCPRSAEVVAVESVTIPDSYVYDITVESCHNFYANGILVHNCQDLNRCQQALAKRAGRRLVLVGDPRQAIYGFAGADAESMPRMFRELREGKCSLCGAEPPFRNLCPSAANGCHRSSGRGCAVLPLTVTRRCGRAIVAEANKIVTDFEAHEINPEGKISRKWLDIRSDSYDGKSEENGYFSAVKDGDMVLCRVNSPLVSECFRFLKAGRKAVIQGRDVGQGLISTLKKVAGASWETLPMVELVSRLSDWTSKEVAKEQAKSSPSEARVIALQDRHDCLMCFAEGAATTSDVIAKIEKVFTDNKDSPGIRLSSIHRAKGLEAQRVFLLEPEGATVPHPMARSAWQREQELNLRYVAITRAIEELVYVS